MFTYLLT